MIMRVWVAVLLCSSLAQAAPVFVSGTGRCPNPPTLAEALRAHLTRLEVVERDEPGAVPVVVVDLGSRFRVSVAGQVREFDDSRRDCEARVATATVFVALVVEPPVNPPPVEVPPATAPDTVTPPPAPRPMQPFFDEPEPVPVVPVAPPSLPWLELQAAIGSSVGVVFNDGNHPNELTTATNVADLAYQINPRDGSYQAVEVGQTGAAPQYLHVTLGAAVRLRPRWSLGLRARIGADIGNNASSINNAPLGNGSGRIGPDFAMLVNLRVALGNKRVHPFFSVGAGGGWIHHLLELRQVPGAPYVDAATANHYNVTPARPGDPKPVNLVCPSGPCVDTVMMGYGLVSGSFGIYVDLVREPKTPVRLVMETELQAGVLAVGLNFDFRIGLEVALFSRKR